MRGGNAAGLVAIAVALLGTPQAASANAEPMLDGRCGDHATPATEIGRGATLRVTQTRAHVWLCIALPPGSYASTDLRIEAPALREPLNLHASAQLGEWPDRPGAAPAGPSDALWWNVAGWSANVTRFNGMDGQRPRFKPVEAREFQLAKSRFGRGRWRLRFTIHDVGGNGSPLVFPDKGGDYEIVVR